MAGDELIIHDWLKKCQTSHPSVSLGIGDDMAIVDTTSGQILLSSDVLLDGVHFDFTKHSPEQIGRKAMACALSDCAAMAVKPVGVTISLALPNAMDMSMIQGLYEGIRAIAAEFDVPVVGGDTTRWEHPLAIDVAMAAVPHENIKPVTRNGAGPTDGIWVTGMLGGSLLGRHLSFTPRIREAYRLAKTLGHRLHAMIDLSDGLSLDLWRVCRASGVGAQLNESLLQAVIHEDARRLSQQDKHDPLDHALADGEDFELLLAVGSDVDDSVIQSMDVDLYPVGHMIDSGFYLVRGDGSTETMEPKGFIH